MQQEQNKKLRQWTEDIWHIWMTRINNYNLQADKEMTYHSAENSKSLRIGNSEKEMICGQ